jgi:hypothetical protein
MRSEPRQLSLPLPTGRLSYQQALEAEKQRRYERERREWLKHRPAVPVKTQSRSGGPGQA